MTTLNTSASPTAVPPQIARYVNGPLSEDRQFDFLIGDWNVKATKFNPGGAALAHYEALWSARSLNEGRMIVDDFKALAPDGRPISSFVTLRTYCVEMRRWEMVGLTAMQSAGRMEWHGVWVDGEMRIDAVGLDPSGCEVRTRIRFSDISAERFIWASESSVSGGPWQKTASLVATRSEGR